MSDNPSASETMVTMPDPEPEPAPVPAPVPAEEDPAVTFRKGKAKREAKRVQIINTHVPASDPESIAERVAEMVLAKMAAEKNDMVKIKTSPVRATAAKPKSKRAAPPPTPPPATEEKPLLPTKSFGWC